MLQTVLELGPILLTLIFFYFILIRPMRKKLTRHMTLVRSLEVGDKVITDGGIYGVVKSFPDEESLIFSPSDGVLFQIRRRSISEKLEEGSEVARATSPKWRRMLRPLGLD